MHSGTWHFHKAKHCSRLDTSSQYTHFRKRKLTTTSHPYRLYVLLRFTWPNPPLRQLPSGRYIGIGPYGGPVCSRRREVWSTGTCTGHTYVQLIIRLKVQEALNCWLHIANYPQTRRRLRQILTKCATTLARVLCFIYTKLPRAFVPRFVLRH